MPKHTLTFTKEKETKGTVKFEEVPDPNKGIVIGSLYIRRPFADKAPGLKVTVEIPD